MSGAPLMKDGDLISNAYREWVRSLPCACCGRSPRSEVQHAPTRGASGVTNDLKSHPACRRCHVRCGGQSVVERGQRLPPIPLADQLELVAATFARFWERAPWSTVEKVLVDVKAWRDSRVWIEA